MPATDFDGAAPHLSSAQLQSVRGARLVTLMEHRDARGALLALDQEQGVPFPLRRAFYIYDVPHDASRAGHAVSCEFLMIAVSGQVTVSLSDGAHVSEVQLRDPRSGIHTMPGVFVELKAFSPGAVLLVLSSKLFSEVNYASSAFVEIPVEPSRSPP